MQVATHRRGVADRRHPAVAERALDEEIPLPRLPVLEVAVEARLPDAVDLRRFRIAADRRRDRRRIREADHRYARRARAVRLLQHAAREVRDAVVHRAREVAGVGRQVGDAETAAQHGPVVPLIRGADPRSPVVVGRIPQVAAVAVDARERDRPGRAEGALSREIPRRHAVGPLGRPRLHFPPQPEVDRQLRRRAPVVLRVDREVLLREVRGDVGARADPPDPRPEQHRRGIDAALRVGRHERRHAAARGRVLEVEVAALVRKRRRHRDRRLLGVVVVRQQVAELQSGLVHPLAARLRQAAAHAVVGLPFARRPECAGRQARPVAAATVAPTAVAVRGHGRSVAGLEHVRKQVVGDAERGVVREPFLVAVEVLRLHAG